LKFTLSKVKKILLCALLLQMLITFQTISTNASPAAEVKVEPQSNTASAGENFTINITIIDVQNLFGLDITLYWNASILQIVTAEVRLGVESHPDGVLHEPIFPMQNETNQEEGKYQLAATSTGQATSSFSGSGNIARITFNVRKAGSCDLNLETKLASKPPLGGVSTPIEHTTIDGFFGQETQEQTIWPYVIIVAVVIVTIAIVIVVYSKRAKKKLK